MSVKSPQLSVCLVLTRYNSICDQELTCAVAQNHPCKWPLEGIRMIVRYRRSVFHRLGRLFLRSLTLGFRSSFSSEEPSDETLAGGKLTRFLNGIGSLSCVTADTTLQRVSGTVDCSRVLTAALGTGVSVALDGTSWLVSESDEQFAAGFAAIGFAGRFNAFLLPILTLWTRTSIELIEPVICSPESAASSVNT
jgi:hypothetical protein